MMAKQRKPLGMQKGNLTVLQQERKRIEEEYVRTGKDQLKTPPKWLIDEISKKEFRRIVKELKEIHLIGNLDLNNLGAYCNAFSNYIHVTEELDRQVKEIAIKQLEYIKKKAELTEEVEKAASTEEKDIAQHILEEYELIQPDWSSYCLTRYTRTGEIIVRNPLIDIQANYADEMRKFAALCGLTIDSRLKAATTKINKTQEEIHKKFGGI